MGDGEFKPDVLEGERDASLIGEFRRLPHAFITSRLAFLWCSKPEVEEAIEPATYTGSTFMLPGLVDLI